MIKIYYTISAVLTAILLIVSCKPSGDNHSKPVVVTTTTMITDIVKQIGGNVIDVKGLMGAGVDPHLYKASEGDVNKLFNADMVIYNGLHLEGKLTDLFEKMEHRGVKTLALADTIDPNVLIHSKEFAASYDPHIWFDISLWRQCITYAASKLIVAFPEHKNTLRMNLDNYLTAFDSTALLLNQLIDSLPPEKRVLITAHDAFSYFGRAYHFDVMGLQGISTASEAGVQDVQNMARTIADRRIKAIFVESSVPRRNIEALQQAVKSKGFNVAIGGELFSDACGDAGTHEGTYLGMFEHNVRTILHALK